MNRNEIVVLQKMKSDFVNEKNLLAEKLNQLTHKIEMVEQLMSGMPVIEDAEVSVAPTPARTPAPKKPATKKGKRTASPDSILSRIQVIIQDNPEIEFSTGELTAELKGHWPDEYAKKDNLLSVISAIMTAKDTVKVGWFTKTKKGGKWYFQAATPAPIKKTA